MRMHRVVQGPGVGVPVVMSHALGVDLAMWDGLAATLAVDHPVLRYDHRGHGDSDVPPGPYTMDQLVDDAARIVADWNRGPVLFVGLSMGGMVGQGLAIRHPSLVRGLVLANNVARYPAEAQPAWRQRIETVLSSGMAPLVDGVIERWLAPATRASRPQIEADIRATLLSCDPRGYAACCAAVASVDWLDRLHEIKCPTLVIAGALDIGATPAMGQAIAERIAGADFEVLDGAAHLSVAEQPEAFAASVKAFIAKLG